MAKPACTAHIQVGAVLLAAGASSRMGQPKQLLPWGSTSVLGHLVQQWRKLAPVQVAVVCDPTHQRVSEELDQLAVAGEDRIFNHQPERGMFSSIQCAARWKGWNGALTHWALILGDQPQVALSTLRQLLDFVIAHPNQICQPSRAGRPRHPVLMPGAVFRRLAGSKDENLKQFLPAQPEGVALFETDDPTLDFDLDTPADYQEAIRRFSVR